MAPKKKAEKAVGGLSKKAEVKPEVENVDENLSPADQLRKEGIVTTYALSNKRIHRNVRDINVTNLTVTFHGTPLIDEAELSLNYGNRYGLLGRNGCGKSTFMRVIGARSFPIPDGIDIFHLSEEIAATDMTAKEAVMSVDTERAELEKEAEELNEVVVAQEGSEEAEEAMERLTQVYERLEELDAATAEARASRILCGLGFSVAKQSRKTREFSGGWRMRIALARALFLQPTLLLLDEPTNHLDMEAVVWLEEYLRNWKKILLMVSHSQDFLNNVCTHIIHHHRKKLLYYSGNYDAFVKTRSEKEEEQEKRYKSEQDQIKHMKQYVAKFGQGNAKMAKQAQSKEKTLEKMLRSGLTEKVEHDKALDFKFPDCSNLSPPVLQCNDITFGYPGCEVLYTGVDFGVDLDSRVALVGPNGAGKSTLLKLLTGELLPVKGTVRPHPHLRIAKFSQHFIDVLDLSLSPLDYFLATFTDMTREEGRRFLGRFGISGSVQTQVIGQLSDGQKSRVVLAKMAKENPHLLLLDEPTNHLDMESIDSLAKAINSFNGGMVLVSHDMRLISQVAREIWLCDNRTVMKYIGDISDFKMHLRKQMDLEPNGEVGEVKLVPLVQKKFASASDPPIDLKNFVVPEIVPMKADAATLSTIQSPTKAEPEPALKDGESEQKDEDDKAALKAKRKAEREAMQALQAKEEEERQRRREEKLREAEEAKKAKELEQQRLKQLEEEKAAQEVKYQLDKLSLTECHGVLDRDVQAARIAAEQAEQLLLVEAEQRRKAERQARKVEKQMILKALKEERDRAFAEAVTSDLWTQEQQTRLEEALLEYTCTVEKVERWTKIANHVGDKSKQQCLARYKYLKAMILTGNNN